MKLDAGTLRLSATDLANHLACRHVTTLDRGVAQCAKKLGEEAIETALAAVGEERDRLIAEASDLIYHLLVLLKARGIALAEVEQALAVRTTQSGLDEKAARKHS